MRGFKFNFITILAFVLLVVYAYLAAMGWLYQGHKIEIAGMFFIGVVAIISLCIYLMCTARATRWQKVGTPTQIALGVLIVGIFFFISKPFSSYVTMMGRQTEVYNQIDSVVTAAKDLNKTYLDYANERIYNYSPKETTLARRDIRVNALRMQLMPPDLAAKQPDRNKWLDDIANMKLHNIQMPNNLANMDSCVYLWMNDYTALSEVIFEDEQDVEPFQYASFATQYANLRNNLGSYSIWALFVAMICSVFMLIPYFTTETDLSLLEGNNEGWLAKFTKRKSSGNIYGDNGSAQEPEGDYM
ncbi:MAG: hypothetical protein IJQ84_00300 [Paludibacteraceae bacterium]|nr:hypothetical protein [Paludibacteraceae bacterium]